MHRTCVASLRNSIGTAVVQSEDDDKHNSNHTAVVAVVDSQQQQQQSSSSLLTNANRIQNEAISSSIVINEILSPVTSSSSESLCAAATTTTDHWKVSFVAQKRNRHHSSRPQLRNNDWSDDTELDDVTETTTATMTGRSISENNDTIIQANQPSTIVEVSPMVVIDINCEMYTDSTDRENILHMDNENDVKLTPQQFKDRTPSTSTTQQIQEHERQQLQNFSVEHVTSYLQNINLLRNKERNIESTLEEYINDQNTTNRSDDNMSNGTQMIQQQQQTIQLGVCDEENRDATTLYAPKPTGSILPTSTARLGRTHHNTRRYVLNSNQHHDDDTDSSDCWTEEECGTATSSDFMVLPILHNNKLHEYSSSSSHHLSHHYRHQPPQNDSSRISNDDDDEDDNDDQSSHSSSTGCTVDLSIQSCQSSVTWYEGSNIDEIDITNHSSDNAESDEDDGDDDDADALLSLFSDNLDRFSTYT